MHFKQLESGKPNDRAEAQPSRADWQCDTQLGGIRVAAALAKLPADEQKVFTQLWVDVAAVVKEADANRRQPG